MLTLIKREIDDTTVVVAIMVAVALILVGLLWVFQLSYEIDVGEVEKRPPIGFSASQILVAMLATFVLPFLSAGLGVHQMYTDRTKKISSFLCTLAVTRGRLMAARMVAGVICILVLLSLILVGYGVFFRAFPRLLPLNGQFVLRLILLALGTNLAGYAVGLRTGWNPAKALPSVGSLFLTFLIVTVAAVEGMSNFALLLLFLVILALLLCAWNEFMRSPL